MGMLDSMRDLKEKANKANIDDKAMEQLKRLRHKKQEEQPDKD